MYVSQEQFYDIQNQHDMIQGSLNRIAVTDDCAEIDERLANLEKQLDKFLEANRDRINGVYHKPEPEVIPGAELILDQLDVNK